MNHHLPRILYSREGCRVSLFASLEAAARLVIMQDGFDPNDLNYEHWATTYRTSSDAVREAIKIALNGSRKLPEEVACAAPKALQTEEDE